MKLYFAPMNFLSNYVYRHFVLGKGADFVFSELILIKDFDKEVFKDKLKFFKEDVSKTIFQIGVSSVNELVKGVKLIKKYVPDVKEINLNVDCPESRMQQNKLCAGLLFDLNLLKKVCEKFVELAEDFMPSVKIRLGTSEKDIKIKEYLSLISKTGIKKVYIHARPLRYSYDRPARINFLQGLRSEFADLDLIFNGDVDSYDSYYRLKGDVMVGRAALINPFVFEHIKNKVSANTDKFNPCFNDVNILKIDGKNVLSNKKKTAILEFLLLCKKEDLRMQLVKNNLNYLLKGVTKGSIFLKKFYSCDNLDEVISCFKHIFY
jgi:tRNA-dihydrouridine synthase